jgi:hypothetical protein
MCFRSIVFRLRLPGILPPTCVVKLVDREAVLDKLTYTAANPVLDRLVERVRHWPGVNGLPPTRSGPGRRWRSCGRWKGTGDPLRRVR